MTKEEALEKIKELEAYVEGIDKKKSIFNIQKGDKYWYINSEGYVHCSIWNDDDIDLARRDSGNAFITKGEAEKERDKRQALQRIKKTIWEKGYEFEPDWSDTRQDKYFILYDHGDREYAAYDYHFQQYIGTPFFFSETSHAEDIIKLHKEDLDILRS